MHAHRGRAGPQRRAGPLRAQPQLPLRARPVAGARRPTRSRSWAPARRRGRGHRPLAVLPGLRRAPAGAAAARPRPGSPSSPSRPGPTWPGSPCSGIPAVNFGPGRHRPGPPAGRVGRGGRHRGCLAGAGAVPRPLIRSGLPVPGPIRLTRRRAAYIDAHRYVDERASDRLVRRPRPSPIPPGWSCCAHRRGGRALLHGPGRPLPGLAGHRLAPPQDPGRRRAGRGAAGAGSSAGTACAPRPSRSTPRSSGRTLAPRRRKGTA